MSDPVIEIGPGDNESPVTPRSKQAITEVGLPELQGSPEQVARGRDARTALLMKADDYLTELRTNGVLTDSQRDTDIVSPQQVSHEQVLSAQAALNDLRHLTDAEWWIVHAADPIEQLLQTSNL